MCNLSASTNTSTYTINSKSSIAYIYPGFFYYIESLVTIVTTKPERRPGSKNSNRNAVPVHLHPWMCLQCICTCYSWWLMTLQRLSLWQHVHRWRQRLPLHMRSRFYRIKLSVSHQSVRLQSVSERRTLLQTVADVLRLFVSARIHRTALWELHGVVCVRPKSVSQWRHVCAAQQSLWVSMSVWLGWT